MKPQRFLTAMGVALLAALPCAEAGESPYQLKLADVASFKLNGAHNPIKRPYAAQIEQAAQRNGVDAALLHAIIATESAYRVDAVSPAGAIGLMQLMPATAQRFGVSDARSARQNIDGGAAYLNLLLKRYNNNIDLAIAAYNAGEGAVDAHAGSIPPYAETQRYVPAVKARYRALQQESSPYRLNADALKALQ